MSKEIIEKFVHVDNDQLGYEIHTSKQVITLFISNSAGCCESWGVITTEDKLPDYVGSELLSIEVVDKELNVEPLLDFSLDEGGACFVNVNTSDGVLQFVLYNSHNGYYGHYVTINSEQLQYETGV